MHVRKDPLRRSVKPPISYRLPPIGLDLAHRFFQRLLLLGVDVLKLLDAIRVGLWPTIDQDNCVQAKAYTFVGDASESRITTASNSSAVTCGLMPELRGCSL